MSLLFTTFCTAFAFYLLLSVVPLYAVDVGASTTGAGSVTAVFMLTAVLVQLRMPKVLTRVSYRSVLTVGLVLFGPFAVLYLFAEHVLLILAITLVRGAGFGAAIVVFAALVVELVSPEHRGEGLGLYGVAIALPAILGSPLGLWLAERLGYVPTFLIGGTVPLLGVLAVLGMSRSSRSRVGDSVGFLAGLRRRSILRLFLLFAVSTAVAGAFVTFLPLNTSQKGPFSAATTLLLFWVASASGRWWAGRFGDLHGPRLLIEPGLVTAILGMVALSLSRDGPILLCGGLLLGAGFGILQSTTLMMTMERVADADSALGSTLWNVAFDAGTGLGPLLFGLVVGAAGFSSAWYFFTVLLATAFVFVPPGD